MLERIQAFLHKLSGSTRQQDFEPSDPRVAFAALCFQVMEVDGRISKPEERRFKELLRDRYALDDAGMKALMKAGQQAGSEAVDYHRFTTDLKRHLVNDQDRIELLRILRELSYADGERREIETDVIWRIAELLDVSDPDDVADTNGKTG